jgi:esterase/lipase superfamily enzyme
VTDGQTDRRTDGRHNDFSRAHFLKMCSKNIEKKRFSIFTIDNISKFGL